MTRLSEQMQLARSLVEGGMPVAQAAANTGVKVNTLASWASTKGLTKGYGRNAERMRALHADPEFKAKMRAQSAERMRALNADPEFKAKMRAQSAERMRALHADPEFKATLSRRRARKVVLLARFPLTKALVDEAAALLAAGHDIETAADSLVQDAFSKRRSA